MDTSPSRIQILLKAALDNFAPLVVFYGVNHFYGLMPAITASAVFSIADIAWKLFRGKKITKLFVYSAIVTVSFGCVDIYAQRSFLFKYEACVTNVFTAIFFGATLLNKKPLLMEFDAPGKPQTPDRIAFFRILTGVWTLYFLLKAAAYFWIAGNFTLEQGLLIRTLAGSASFYALLAVSILGGKTLFLKFKEWRLLPEAD